MDKWPWQEANCRAFSWISSLPLDSLDEVESMLAPRHRRNSTTLVFPRAADSTDAVLPSFVRASISAPESTRPLTVGSSPLSHGIFYNHFESGCTKWSGDGMNIWPGLVTHRLEGVKSGIGVPYCQSCMLCCCICADFAFYVPVCRESKRYGLGDREPVDSVAQAYS